MLLPSYTFSSDPLPRTTPPPSATTPTDPRAFARGREAAARRHGHTYKRKYVEIALRIAGGGVHPVYARAFPSLLAQGPRTVDDFVRWLASSDRPPGIDPAEGKLNPRRALRKRQQVANLLLACQACLRPLLHRRQQQQEQQEQQPPIRVVEFCCGTGHVGLPLTLLHPSIHVLLLDVSEAAIAIAHTRVAAAGLADRVECRVGTVEDFLVLQQKEGTAAFHLGIALHACGPATDLSMEAMLRARAAFVLCPCCVGKIQHAPPSLAYPRSQSVRQALLPEAPIHTSINDQEEAIVKLRADYAVLASAADVSVRSFAGAVESRPADAEQEEEEDDDEGEAGEEEEGANNGGEQGPAHRQRQRQRRLCKSMVETDRCLRAAERGYRTRLMLLTPRVCTPKNDLLFGWPGEWEEDGDREGEDEQGNVVVVPLLEAGGPLGAEAVAFDAWFGDAEGDGGGVKEEGPAMVEESH